MITAANNYGGLQIADVVKLFTNKSGPFSNSAIGAAQSTMATVPTISAGTPFQAFKAALTQTVLARAAVAQAAFTQAELTRAATSETPTWEDGFASGDIYYQPSITAESLVVGTSEGVVATATGTSNYAAAATEWDSIEYYKGDTYASQFDNYQNDISVGGSSYLQLTIQYTHDSGDFYEKDDMTIDAQNKALELVDAYKNNTLSPGSNDVNGFSYTSLGNYNITAVEIHSDKVMNTGMYAISDAGRSNCQFKDIYDESVSWGGTRDIDIFAIPLSSS